MEAGIVRHLHFLQAQLSAFNLRQREPKLQTSYSPSLTRLHSRVCLVLAGVGSISDQFFDLC